MLNLICVYRGGRLITASADHRLVAAVTDALLMNPDDGDGSDPVLARLTQGRRDALRIVRREAENADAAI